MNIVKMIRHYHVILLSNQNHNNGQLPILTNNMAMQGRPNKRTSPSRNFTT